jgi:excinuclease ABC subunit A
MAITHITVRGARQHNLRNVSVEIPRNTLTVVTGLSGSGKSSLAFDTIYAEGQRRYVETLSAYARQFLDQMERPDVDVIDGLSPAISIEQKTTSRSPRSTVGTITEIYDYLRLLYASVGQPHCPNCGLPITRQTPEQIVAQIVDRMAATGERITVFAPLVRGRKGEFREELDALDQQGFRARIDGEMVELTEGMRLDKKKNHTVEAIVDRVILKPIAGAANGKNEPVKYDTSRLEASIAKALQMAKGLVLIATQDAETRKQVETLYSSSMACPDCGINVAKLEPRSFSFNSTYGACPECHGLGSIYDFDPAKTITDWSKPLLDGAMGPGSGSAYLLRLIKLAAEKYKISLKQPFEKLTKEQQDLFLYGPPKGEGGRTGFHGIFAYLRANLEETRSEGYREYMMQYMSATACPRCKGRRLRPESLAVTVKVRGEAMSIADFTALSLERALEGARAMQFSGRERVIADRLQREIIERLEFLNAVGLDYLSLERSAATLSGGEGQRIRLATQIGSRLRGVLYVLDEPSIGLHQRDNARLLEALTRLRDLGNSVIVVEHDEEIIRAADHVIDMGPRAGVGGGRIVAAGTPEDIAGNTQSLTGAYLSGRKAIDVPRQRRQSGGRALTVRHARGHNLHDLTVGFPIGVLTCVTGVSGSGKSTLVIDTLLRALAHRLHHAKTPPEAHEGLDGLQHVDKVIDIDQAPIGRTPRSNPSTYTGVFTHVRDLFANLPESKARGYKPGRYSFNVKGGRCEACQGDGIIRIEMHFLPDVYIECEACGGRRYNRETLEVRYRQASIADVLDMTVNQACDFLENIPKVRQKLETLREVGLGYLKLGQSATTLSGGEAQRIKLSKELAKKSTGRTVYILDEPTTGLHFADIAQLLSVLNRLVDAGNTVIVIEHNLDVIKTADWVIDLGPEGGPGGGQIIAQGPPDDVARVAQSYTGQFLRKVL